MFHSFFLIYCWLVRLILIWLPDAPIVMRFRGALYGLGMRKCGRNFQVSSSTILRGLEKLSVGDDVYFAPGVVVNAIGPIALGSGVMIGFNSVLVSGNHSLHLHSYRFGKSLAGEISVGSGAWIGANCTVLSGARLGDASLLAANSCTSGELEDLSIYGGVPARRLREGVKL